MRSQACGTPWHAQVAEETSKKIEAASALYRPCSVRASVLYFVLNDLTVIDPMYQVREHTCTESGESCFNKDRRTRA